MENARLTSELDKAKNRENELLAWLRAFEIAMAGVNNNEAPPSQSGGPLDGVDTPLEQSDAQREVPMGRC